MVMWDRLSSENDRNLVGMEVKKLRRRKGR